MNGFQNVTIMLTYLTFTHIHTAWYLLHTSHCCETQACTSTSSNNHMAPTNTGDKVILHLFVCCFTEQLRQGVHSSDTSPRFMEYSHYTTIYLIMLLLTVYMQSLCVFSLDIHFPNVQYREQDKKCYFSQTVPS